MTDDARHVQLEPERVPAVIDAVAGNEAAGDAAHGEAEASGRPRETMARIITEAGLFDEADYFAKNQDVAQAGTPALRHFLEFGVGEDRRPNAYFHTQWYLRQNPDVALAALQPLVHYAEYGEREGRWPCPYFDPLWYRATYGIARGENALGHYLAHRHSGRFSPVAAFDVAHYIKTNPDVAAAATDPFEHFFLYGFREGRNPSASFDVRDYADRHLGGDLSVNPLLHLLMTEPPAAPPPSDAYGGKMEGDEAAGRGGTGIFSTRFGEDFFLGSDSGLLALRRTLHRAHPAGAAAADGTGPEQLIATEFDSDYYLGMNHDVRDSGIDPLRHYLTTGWQEKRKPNSWFDTDFYLNAYPDVLGSGQNPFWHFLAAGRAEGRQPRKGGGFRREIIDNLRAPHEKTRDYTRSPPAELLSGAELKAGLAARLNAKRGLALSVSHDCYIRSVGGIQIFLADEQAGFARRGLAYLNISPWAPDLVLAAPTAARHVQLVLDGTYFGVVEMADLIGVLEQLAPRSQEERLFIVHCLLGHEPEMLAALQAAAAADQNFFWLHDFSSLCEGFNLLRNDIEFCDGPPPESLGCRVCIYGATRRAHLERVAALFRRVPFVVVAPSRSALAIWRSACDLPHVATLVHPHCVLAEGADRPTAAAAAGTQPNPVRVAFIGHPVAHKGWPLFLEIVETYRKLDCYRFYHFTSEVDGVGVRGVTKVIACTSPMARDGMIEALAANAIDIVLVMAPWPETFSYVTYEALAAGADIVTGPDSGNVVDVVLTRERGIIVQNDAALHDLFDSLRLVKYVRQCQLQGTKTGRLLHRGTTATLDPVLLAEAAE